MRGSNSKANCRVLSLSNGREVLISYTTPVAGFVPGLGHVATERKYSVTTSRHVNQYAREAKVLPEAEFRSLFAEFE